MQEYIEQFLAHVSSKRGLTGNTIAAYRTDLDQLVSFLLERGSTDWNSVSQDDILAFMLFLRERQYANSTVARRTAAVKSFFTYLVKSGLIPQSPTKGIESPKVDRCPPHAISTHQIDELLELPLRTSTPEGLRDKAMLELLYATGMRVSELVALNVLDLDLDTSTLRCIGKAGRERTLPLNTTSVTALEEYLSTGRPQLVRTNGETSQELFLNHRGRRLTRQGFWLILKSYAEELGLQNLTPHTLRHSFAAHMLNNGAELHEVQTLLGHASLSTTQIYTTLTNGKSTNGEPARNHQEKSPPVMTNQTPYEQTIVST